MKRYDTIIIGFGKGGKTMAAFLGKQGKRVAILEKSNKMYGGTCINEGCIPSKSLIIQAERNEYSQAIEQKETLITKLRKKNFDKLNNMENVDVITAQGSFINDHEIEIIDDGIQDVLYGDTIIINTGSIPIIPSISGLKECKHIYDSAELMKTKILPRKLAIIGGGYIGLEFSSMYARYGSVVTVFEQGERLVKREDKDIADEIQHVLEKQNVAFVFESKIEAFEEQGDSVMITYRDHHNDLQKALFDAVLLATGRTANTSQLHLDKAGVRVDPRGTIIVNEYLQTNVEHIFALGDVKGGLQFTYISLDDFRIVKDFLFGKKERTTKNRGHIAYSVFISPTFSRVGLSEQEANKQGYDTKVFTLPAAAIPRANVISQTDGILKAICDAKTNRILGCTLFCAESEELINFIQLAMNQNLTYQQVRDHIFTHPSMSEALNDLFQAV